MAKNHAAYAFDFRKGGQVQQPQAPKARKHESTKADPPANELPAKSRKALASSTFGLPAQRKYPMSDKPHAANAKARATQMVNKGKLSGAAKSTIDAKANRILAK